jgi:hypothetical protein
MAVDTLSPVFMTASMTAPSPFPTLAYFAVWNRTLARDGLRGGGDEAADADNLDALAFAAPASTSSEYKARRVGLAQGLVDFTRYRSNHIESPGKG